MYGAININAVTYWLDTSPGMTTASARRSGPATVTGKLPGVSPGVTDAPNAASESYNGPIGRARNGGSPSIVYSPEPSAHSAVTKRDVVPARPA